MHVGSDMNAQRASDSHGLDAQGLTWQLSIDYRQLSLFLSRVNCLQKEMKQVKIIKLYYYYKKKLDK